MKNPTTHALGGDLLIHRLGFGAMRLTGDLDWGLPADPAHALKVAQRAVELGIDFIDTADAYGPHTNELQLAEALHPYPEHLVLATKAGQTRPSPHEWVPLGRPEYLRQQCELSLRHLRVERIDLYQLHRIDPTVPAAEQFGALARLQRDGKVRHIGLSEVTVEQIEEARQIVDVASVQNRFNLTDRAHEPVLDYCTAHGIAFIPWLPIASGEHARPGGPVAGIAEEIGATPAQVALAWLLHRSPVTIPIPGTSNLAHLRENAQAAAIDLTDDQFDRLNRLV